MSALGLPILDKAVQDCNQWLGELMRELGCDDRQRTYRLLRAVLHTLRDRLQVDEAANLAAQLPTVIRGIYYEGWRPSRVPTGLKRSGDFVAAVEADFVRDPNENPEQAVRAALAVIASHVSPGEIEDVKSSLPPDIRSLWQ